MRLSRGWWWWASWASGLFNVGEVGLVDRRGLLELPEVAVRLLFLPWLFFSVASRVRGSCARCPVLSLGLMVVLVLSGP